MKKQTLLNAYNSVNTIRAKEPFIMPSYRKSSNLLVSEKFRLSGFVEVKMISPRESMKAISLYIQPQFVGYLILTKEIEGLLKYLSDNDIKFDYGLSTHWGIYIKDLSFVETANLVNKIGSLYKEGRDVITEEKLSNIVFEIEEEKTWELLFMSFKDTFIDITSTTYNSNKDTLDKLTKEVYSDLEIEKIDTLGDLLDIERERVRLQEKLDNLEKAEDKERELSIEELEDLGEDLTVHDVMWGTIELKNITEFRDFIESIRLKSKKSRPLEKKLTIHDVMWGILGGPIELKDITEFRDFMESIRSKSEKSRTLEKELTIHDVQEIWEDIEELCNDLNLKGYELEVKEGERKILINLDY